MTRFAAIVLLAVSLPSLAARPLSTEDASILEDKACQLEAWLDRSRVETLAWAAPACNFGAGIEWQAGAARSSLSSGFAAYAQAKGVFALSGELGAGWVVGLNRHPQHEPTRGWDNPYVIIPLTWSRPDAGVTVHANVGWSRDRQPRLNFAPWGLAIEGKSRAGTTLLAEVFGADRGRPFLRVGGRHEAIKDRLDLDVSIVTRPGGTAADRFISIGMHAQTPRFLP